MQGAGWLRREEWCALCGAVRQCMPYQQSGRARVAAGETSVREEEERGLGRTRDVRREGRVFFERWPVLSKSGFEDGERALPANVVVQAEDLVLVPERRPEPTRSTRREVALEEELLEEFLERHALRSEAVA